MSSNNSGGALVGRRRSRGISISITFAIHMHPGIPHTRTRRAVGGPAARTSTHESKARPAHMCVLTVETGLGDRQAKYETG